MRWRGRANAGHTQATSRTSPARTIECMAMSADEVYEALDMLLHATAYEFDEIEKRWRKRFDDLENRMQRRLDGIWNKLDEIGGPDR
jgi:hypothetical protein